MRLRSGQIAVLLQDSGTGIDQNNIEQIFKPFFTTKTNGMGIGLAICRTISWRKIIGITSRTARFCVLHCLAGHP
jgi:C4-dicarboxylate-specific signal transduction histidine kinase